MFGLLLLSYAEDQSSITIAHTDARTHTYTPTVTAPTAPITPHIHTYIISCFTFSQILLSLKLLVASPPVLALFSICFWHVHFPFFRFVFAFAFLMLVDWCAHTHRLHSLLLTRLPAHSFSLFGLSFARASHSQKLFFVFRARLIGFIFGPELG